MFRCFSLGRRVVVGGPVVVFRYMNSRSPPALRCTEGVHTLTLIFRPSFVLYLNILSSRDLTRPSLSEHR